MSVVEGVKILKKRGRKPKNVQPDFVPIEEEIQTSEKEVIVAFLPISLNDIEYKETKYETSETFLKPIIENNTNYNNLNYEIPLNDLCGSENNGSNGIYINKINIHNIVINSETKCWWCKNCFGTPNVVLPEQYFNNTFYCIGNFCSYNCTKAYNIDLNDNNIWKRESLINLMYYLTYKKHKKIDPSPSWLILKDFGGVYNICDFRKNFETNIFEYILLYPPLISRQMQIEESYKKNIKITGPINKIDKLFSSDNYALKRTKPIETSQLNLEKTMGLRKVTT